MVEHNVDEKLARLEADDIIVGGAEEGKEDEDAHLQKKTKLDERIEYYLEKKEYDVAHDYLTKLLLMQDDSWARFDTLQQMAVCEIMTKLPYSETVSQIIAVCKKLELPAAQLEKKGRDFLENEHYIRAFILCQCSAEMSKEEINASRQLKNCVSLMAEVIYDIPAEPRLMKVAVNIIIPLMEETLEKFREVRDIDEDRKVDMEALCLDNIGQSYSNVGNNQKCIDFCNRGIALMTNHFGRDSTNYQSFITLVQNLRNAENCLQSNPPVLQIYKFVEDGDEEEPQLISDQADERYSDQIDEDTSFLRTKELEDVLAHELEFLTQGACETLEELLLLEKDPWNRFDRLQQLMEHKIKSQAAASEMRQLLLGCRDLDLSITDLTDMAEEHIHIDNDSPVRAIVLYECVATLYKINATPTEAIQGILQCMNNFVNATQCFDPDSYGTDERNNIDEYVASTVIMILDSVQQLGDPSDGSQLLNIAHCMLMGGELVKVDLEDWQLHKKLYNASLRTAIDLETLLEEIQPASIIFKKGREFMEKHFGSNAWAYSVYKKFKESFSICKKELMDKLKSLRQQMRPQKREGLDRLEMSDGGPLNVTAGEQGSKDVRADEKLLKAKEKSDALLERADYALALPNLVRLLAMQQDDRFETLQKIAECKVMNGLKHAAEIDKLLSTSQSQDHPLNFKAIAKEHHGNQEYVQAMISYECLSRSADSIKSIEESIPELKCIAHQMVQDLRSRKLIPSFVISTIQRMIIGVRKLYKANNDKVVVCEAKLHDSIGYIYGTVLGEAQKSIEAYGIGIKAMNDQFGERSTKYKVFGFQLRSLGSMHATLGDVTEAREYYTKSLDALSKAENLDDQEKFAIKEIKTVIAIISKSTSPRIRQPSGADATNEPSVSGSRVEKTTMGIGSATSANSQGLTTDQDRTKEFPSLDIKGVHLNKGVYVDETKQIRPGSRVFYGAIDSLHPECVAVKILEDTSAENKRESENLIALSRHDNVVMCRASGEFKYRGLASIYVAMDMCEKETLQEKVEERSASETEMPNAVEVLWQIVNGMSHLHKKHIIHRDLKPLNILFSKNDGKVKISDFGFSKKLIPGKSMVSQSSARRGTDGWRAPETYTSGEISRKADVFSVGLIIYNVLSNGKHAFGPKPNRWSANIEDYEGVDLTGLVCDEPEVARHLVKKMLMPKPEQRPDISEVLNHPLFWDDHKKRNFLCAISDFLKDSSFEALVDQINAETSLIFHGNWVRRLLPMEDELEKIKSQRRYAKIETGATDARGPLYVIALKRHKTSERSTLLGLLRFIRNRVHHLHEDDKDVHAMYKTRGGMWKFFSQRFPKLLITVYNAAGKFLREASENQEAKDIYDTYYLF